MAHRSNLLRNQTRVAPAQRPADPASAALAASAAGLNAWATEQGLSGAVARELFEGYCARLVSLGFELLRAYVSTQTLHPQWTGYGYTWRREWQSVREQQFARGPVSEEWLRSPFYTLVQRSAAGEKKAWLRRRLELGPEQRDFPALVDFYNAGGTDYLCLGFRFGETADPSHGNRRPSIRSRPTAPAASATRKSNCCIRPCRNCRSP